MGPEPFRRWIRCTLLISWTRRPMEFGQWKIWKKQCSDNWWLGLFLSVKATQLNHIKSRKTSAEAWRKLAEIYRPSGPVRKLSLYKKLLNIRMSADKEIGIALQDELVVVILLSSLPKSYEQFVVAMETRDSLPTFQVLKVK